MGDKGAEALANAPRLDQLTHLMINDNELKEDAMFAVCNSTILLSLEHLDVSHNELKVNGAYIVSVSGNLK